MNDETDDNPFARNSAWPRMPQAPFRVGPMPKAESVEPEPEPRPQKITPLFVRPIEPLPAARLDIGGGVPRAPAPVTRRPTPATLVPTPESAPTPPSDPAMAEIHPEQALIEVSPVIVTAIAKPRPTVRKTFWPAAIAIIVGIAGVLGLTLLLSRVQQANLAPRIAAPATPAVDQPVPAATSMQPVLGPPARLEPVPVIASPHTGPAIPKPVRSQPPPKVRPDTEASAATAEALSAPALTLPEATPPPVYKPPPEVDPAAPVVTREPNS